MKFKPLHNNILVKRIEVETKTAGGILLPENSQEKPSEGEVIAVGNGNMHKNGQVTPLDVKVGDRVFFGKWSGTEIKLDGVDYIIMKETDVFGVLS